jgi:hypothetical protein
MIRFGPFEKFDLRHKLRPNPGALLHVGGGQPFTPASFVRLRKIDEGALGDHQGLESREHLAARSRKGRRLLLLMQRAR